ncbi:MAG: Malto-oligosyltrehalose trehalohydrolase [Tardiphaga sp.]|nr:Malto-oligosyltrehalose trehalohydrolase [Tardiphaga sp.]
MSATTYGPRLTANGATFRLWAPAAKSVDVLIDGVAHPLTRDDDGWYSAAIAGVKAGALYRFKIDGDTEVPDPGSRFQPQDVAGPSEIIDHTAYKWRMTDWRGRPWHETVLIETHVGTFTDEGTYAAMIERLDDLVATGFTALELMPLADFPGRRNWGYDGVLWYAPDSAYGRPDDLKALIDAAHERGLMVFLDVVYNHFGPDGNYLGLYAPPFFSDDQTPWGVAINYMLPQVRAYAVENAVAWLRDYRFDGLRLDAVHAIASHGEVPMLHELSNAVGRLAAETGRLIHLVLENDDNQASLLDPTQEPLAGQYRAQWNDDYHHAWHVLLTTEDKGYYSDYAPNPEQHIARALASGFAYQGEASAHRRGLVRGEPSGELPPLAFVNFIQNHDQIGNRALGDRIDAVAPAEGIAAALAITLLAPTIPMLFQGEDFAATTPFPFFCDFQGDLADAIRNGRRKEFAAAYAKFGDEVPDPLSEATFKSSTLNWRERDSVSGRKRHAMVKELLAIRAREISPRLEGAVFGQAAVGADGILTAQWTLSGGVPLRLVANLSDKAIPSGGLNQDGRAIWGGAIGATLMPWAVHWRVGNVI